MKPATRRVLKTLQSAPRGLTTGELMQPDVGGERFGARVKELREAGFEITTTRERQGSARYVLVDKPTADLPKQGYYSAKHHKSGGLCMKCAARTTPVWPCAACGGGPVLSVAIPAPAEMAKAA